jgi:hypothetical protein
MATYAVHTLFGIRGALESVKGTDLTPTRLLYPSAMEEKREVGTISITPLRNSYRPVTAAYPGIDKATLKFEGPFLYDEQAFWLSLAVKGGITGSGGGADKTWAFLPTAATDDVKSATLQYGWYGGPTLWKLNYCEIQKYRLAWEKAKEVTWGADIITPKVPADLGAFTGSLSELPHVPALGSTWALYIDSTTIGSTPDPLAVSADWELDKGSVVTYPANGTTYGLDVVRPKAETWKLNVTRLYATNTERTAYAAKTERKIRLKTTGPVLGGSFYSFTLDCYGYIDDIGFTEVDGIIAEKMTILPIYDAGAGSDYVISLVNSLGTIT